MKIPFLAQSSRFTQHVFTLSAGTVIAQSIALVMSPIYSRIFLVEQYGILAIYISIISFLDVVVTGRFELAAMNPVDDNDSIHLIAGGVIFIVFYTILFSIIVLIFGDKITALSNHHEINRWYPLLISGGVIIGLTKLFNSWLVRKKAFIAVTVNKVSQRLSETGVTLLTAAFHFSNGLMIGDYAGRLTMMVIAIYQALRKGFTIRRINFCLVIELIKKYKDYPLYNTLPALMNTLGTLVPVFIISFFYGNEITGYFSFSRTMLSVPLALISASISQVLFQDIVNKKNNLQQVTSEVIVLLKQLGVLAILMIVILIAFAPLLFRTVFGSQWVVAGKYTQILVVSYALQFVVSPLSIILPAMNKIKAYSIWQATYFFCICSLVFFKGMPVIMFLFILSGMEILMYFIYLVLILRTCSVYDKSLQR